MTNVDINNNRLSLYDKTLNEELDQMIAAPDQKEKIEISPDRKTPATSESVVIYAQETSEDHEADINGQTSRAVQNANCFNFKVGMTVIEIESGLNSHDSKLIELLRDPLVKVIVMGT